MFVVRLCGIVTVSGGVGWCFHLVVIRAGYFLKGDRIRHGMIMLIAEGRLRFRGVEDECCWRWV